MPSQILQAGQGWSGVLESLSLHRQQQDPMMLVQSSETFECVLAFAGVNNYGFST